MSEGDARPPRVLFVCGHNAGRSIAAEAVARATRGGELEVASCGTYPSGKINPAMQSALEEAGYSTSGLRSKGPDDPEVGGYAKWDLLVTMGCMDGQCPFAPGAATEDWGLPDPAKDAGAVPLVIRAVEERVRALDPAAVRRRADPVNAEQN